MARHGTVKNCKDLSPSLSIAFGGISVGSSPTLWTSGSASLCMLCCFPCHALPGSSVSSRRRSLKEWRVWLSYLGVTASHCVQRDLQRPAFWDSVRLTASDHTTSYHRRKSLSERSRDASWNLSPSSQHALNQLELQSPACYSYIYICIYIM